MSGEEHSEYKWWEKGGPAEPHAVHVVAWGLLGIGLVLLIYGIIRESGGNMMAQVRGPAAAARAGGKPSAAAPTPSMMREELVKMMRERDGLADKADALEEERAALAARNAGLAVGLDEVRLKYTTLTASVEELKKRSEELERKAASADLLRRQGAEMKELLASKQNALDAQAAALKQAAMKQELLQGELASVTGERDKAIAEARLKLAEKEEDIAGLRKALAEYPTAPLSDEQAEQKFNAIEAQLENLSDLDQRLVYLHKARLILAGTKYESQVARTWDGENRKKQALLEQQAGEAYREVSAQVRSQPDKHEENAKLLKEALEKARGTRYESLIERMLRREEGAR